MKVCASALLAFCLVSLSANYVQNKPFELVQPNGSKLSLLVSGDEFEHRMHDANGYTILQHPQSGKAVYAIPEGNGIKASEYAVGEQNPSALGIKPNLWPDPTFKQAALSNRGNYREADSRAPTTGTLNNIVIYIRFLDQAEYTTSVAGYDVLFNTSTQNSMQDFFLEDSNNQLTINTTFYPAAVGGIIRSFQDGHNRGYFSPYNAETNPEGYSDYDEGGARLRAMLRQAVISIGPSVPSSLQVDADGDGFVDNITFIAQGDPDPAWRSVLWPQCWTLDSWPLVYINSRIANRFTFLLSNTFNTGTACHEMSHAIGFPDLYHYSRDGLSPAGMWDLMDSHADIPQHHLAYQKWKYGNWFATIPTINPSAMPTAYSLSSIDQSPFSCYQIASTETNQFYMLEYRRATGDYESNLPGTGLIVYRVCTENGFPVPIPLNGNRYGPPDEIYVYRPGGTNISDGTISDATLASNLGRLSLNNLTDPKPWLYTSPWIAALPLDGNLVITDVTAAGGASINFTVHNSLPCVWKGTTNADWNTASNWSGGAVPNASSWVEIPPSVFINGYGWTSTPLVTGSAYAKHVSIMHGAGLFIAAGLLSVGDNLDNYGTLGVSSAAAQLVIDGDLSFFSGSTADVFTEAHFYLKGDLNMFSGCDVDLYSGYLEFIGSGDSYIRTYDDSQLYRLLSNKGYPYAVHISSDSSHDLLIKNGIFVYAGSTLRQSYPGSTILYGSLNVYEDGYCALDNGTLAMQGSTAQSLYFFSSSSYLNNLAVNKSNNAVISLNSNIWVKQDIIIVAGMLNISTRSIKLGRNWNNSVGSSGFNPGTGTLQLAGSGNQVVSSGHFYRLELNKSAGIWTIPVGVVIEADYYNWTAGAYSVTGGSFSAAFLDDPGIFGPISLSSGTISYNQSSSAALDLRGNLTISGGTFNLSGGNGNVYFSYLDAASLTMSGGVLNLQSQGIFIPSAYPFTDNITNGTIKTVGGLTVQRGDFNPTGGIIEFYGAQDAWISVSTGSNLFNVLINKSSARDSGNELTRANSVSATGILDINGYFKLQAGTFTAPGTMKVAGNWQNLVSPAAFVEGSGSVSFDGTADQTCNNSEAFNTLIINKSNSLKINNVLGMTSCNTYTWTAGSIEVTAGNFTAYDLSQNGIYGNFTVSTMGNINLHQDSNQWIDINGFLNIAGGTINIYGGSLAAYLAYAANAGITMSSGTLDFKNKGLVISPSAHNLTWNIQGGTLALNGSVNDTRGNLVNSAGTIKLYGANAYALKLGTGSRFYNLTIDKQAARNSVPSVTEIVSQGRSTTIDTREEVITAQSDIYIYGSFAVNNGSFDPNGYSIYVNNDLDVTGSIKMFSGGTIEIADNVNWLGTANVSSGTINCGGNWTFGSNSTANLSGSSVFLLASYGCNLTNNSPTAAFGNLEIHGTEEDPVCNYINSPGAALRVSGSLSIFATNTLNLNENPCYAGSANIQELAALIVGDGGLLVVESTLILAGALDIGPGTVYSHGFFSFPASGSLSIDGGSFTNDAPWIERGNFHLRGAISINAGYLEVTNNNVYLYAHPTRSFSNADLYMGRSFTADEPGAFHPNGGTLYLTGENNSSLMIGNGNYLANLVLQLSNANSTVYLNNPTFITGDVQLNSGILEAGSNLLSIGGNIYISSVLSLSSGASLQMAANKGLYVFADGLLSLAGSAFAPVIVSRSGDSGYYSLHVESGGSIAADYSIFEFMDSDGVYIQSGATVDPAHAFLGCTFRNGALGGTLLRIDNAQVLTINEAVFPANTWSGAHNVSKTQNQGMLSIINYSGTFAGAAFEQDAYNRISWQAVGIPPVQNLSINPHPGTSDFVLVWEYAYAYDSFRIFCSPSPEGSYTLLGSTSSNVYAVPSSYSKAFFRVVAVRN